MEHPRLPSAGDTSRKAGHLEFCVLHINPADILEPGMDQRQPQPWAGPNQATCSVPRPGVMAVGGGAALGTRL